MSDVNEIRKKKEIADQINFNYFYLFLFYRKKVLSQVKKTAATAGNVMQNVKSYCSMEVHSDVLNCDLQKELRIAITVL